MIKIGVLGSCFTREVFNSYFVPNYKDFFEINISAQRTTFCSIMQEPLNVDEKSLEILPLDKYNKARSYFIYYDLNKYLIKELLEKEIDYLIIDNYLEIIFGLLYYDDTIITNNHWHLPLTEFYKGITDELSLKITDLPDEYFCIWSKYCDLFFEFLEIYCPNVKVILNKGRLVDKVMRSDKTTYINSSYTLRANMINPILDKLDSYIINNFNVFVFEWDWENIFADETHLWGVNPVHYTRNYHNALTERIKKIDRENNSNRHAINYNFDPKELSFKKRLFHKKLKRANFETKLLLKNIKKQNIGDELKFYNRARIDLKNFGSENNKIEITEFNTPNITMEMPNWFKNEEGQGIIIQSEGGSIDLKFKCVNEGHLRISLRGPDIRDKNKVRFPVYIDLTKLTVNDEIIFNDHILVWQEKPYVFEKKVKDSEVIDFHVDWLPFNSLSTYIK